jgi:hypothetical protein
MELESRGQERYKDHRNTMVHQDQCDSQEWKERMAVGKLVIAHHDGRYR